MIEFTNHSSIFTTDFDFGRDNTQVAFPTGGELQNNGWQLLQLSEASGMSRSKCQPSHTPLCHMLIYYSKVSCMFHPKKKNNNKLFTDYFGISTLGA